eukprot:gnl/TRDRNA2_/TRDRNA2_160979_c4_seq1.p1 gnl/TRDRNA2_/TRDRNA2_160979_c4~~gnl/TRDRNA2_/TRDRNA2_160979_c4_seq1.p1  ORF type:complete len:187 (-),score=30.80 gnl/TRDRNA2_/TRDRNA2_160979_c4_seq1:61-621(-)
MREFNTQELVSIAWASSATAARMEALPLFYLLAPALELRVVMFKTQDLSNAAWAFSTVHAQDLVLFAAMAKLALHCMDTLKPQELSSSVWAFASVRQLDGGLFRALALTAAQCSHMMIAYHLFRTSWALSRCECLQVAWNFFDDGIGSTGLSECLTLNQANDSDAATFSSLRFAAMLTECEQRGLF